MLPPLVPINKTPLLLIVFTGFSGIFPGIAVALLGKFRKGSPYPEAVIGYKRELKALIVSRPPLPFLENRR